MQKGRILLISGFYHPEPIGIGKYNGEMMAWFAARGYECGVVTNYPSYPYWKIQHPYLKRSCWYHQETLNAEEGLPVTVYRCPHFVPAVPIGKKRLLSELSFFLSAFFQVLALMLRKKYDYVITVAPAFQLGLLGLLYRKLTHARFIYHIQDLQIDAASELGMVKSKLFLQGMYRAERYILEKADHVSSISAGMIRKIQAKYNREVVFFPNWVDTRTYHPALLQQGTREKYHLTSTDKIVLYSGAIGEKQGFHTLLCCAGQLAVRRELKFVICSSGPYKEKLMKEAQRMGLNNVIFLPLQSRHTFNEFLNVADVHLVLQKSGANDLVMPSKLSTILSVGGLALVTAAPETSLYHLIAANKLGLVIGQDDPAALTAAIEAAIREPHTGLRNNARRYAEDNLHIDKIVHRYLSHITGPVQESL